MVCIVIRCIVYGIYVGLEGFRATWPFLLIGGILFWGPSMRDPIILGPYYEPHFQMAAMVLVMVCYVSLCLLRL